MAIPDPGRMQPPLLLLAVAPALGAPTVGEPTYLRDDARPGSAAALDQGLSGPISVDISEAAPSTRRLMRRGTRRAPIGRRLAGLNRFRSDTVASSDTLLTAAEIAAEAVVRTGIVRVPTAAELEAEDVSVCVVAMGNATALDELSMLLRSIRATTTRRVAVDVVASPRTHDGAVELLRGTRLAWTRADVTLVTDEQVDGARSSREICRREIARDRHARCRQVRATAARLFHGFDLMPALGPGSLARAFLHHLLPNVDRRVLIASFHPGLVILLERMEHARRCVVLDTDMLLLNDIGIVWSRFAHFGPTTMIAASIVVDHTPTSIMAIKLADLERAGVGLSLQHLARMRDAGRWDVLMHKGWREEAWMMRSVSEQGIMLIALRAAAKRLGDQMDLLRHLPVGWNLAGCSRFSKCHLWKVGYLCADDVDAAAHDGDPTTTDFRYRDKNGGKSRVRTVPGGFECILNGTAPPTALLRRLRSHYFGGAIHANCASRPAGQSYLEVLGGNATSVSPPGAVRMRRRYNATEFYRYARAVNATTWEHVIGNYSQHSDGEPGGRRCVLRGYVWCAPPALAAGRA